MRRILQCVTRRRSRRGWSLIILFKSMPLHQCTLAIFLWLFTSDLWPFGLSINTTAAGKEDVRFETSMLLQQTALKKFGFYENEMNSVTLKFFMSLALMCCATADVPCNASVGIEGRVLPDSSFVASSYKSGHHAYLGRLNNRIRKVNETKRIWGAWCADDANTNQYIQVDLLTVRNVTGLATQGYVYGYVKSYQIMYSVNGKQWFPYKNNSTMKPKIFRGNVDPTKKDNIVRHKLNRVLAARYIRFNPLTWNMVICMRVEVYACELPVQDVPTTIPRTQANPTTVTNIVDIRTSKSEVPSRSDGKYTTMVATERIEEQEFSTELSSVNHDSNSGSMARISFFILFTCIVLVLSTILN